MKLVRIKTAEPLDGFRVRLTLTSGSIVERDLTGFISGAVFEAIRKDPRAFREFHVEAGTLVWPNGADLCPDAILWNGLPPANAKALPEQHLATESG